MTQPEFYLIVFRYKFFAMVTFLNFFASNGISLFSL